MSEVKILEQTETGEVEAPSSSRWLTCLIEAMILLLALVLVVMLRVGVYEPAYIPSRSMENTLRIGDRVLIDHRSGLHGHWRRGDIVLFEAEGNWGDDQDTLIKRVIGLPGETVSVIDGHVLIDGRQLAEDYLKEPQKTEDQVQVKLGHGEYFVMGDNRNNSDDSRYNGAVKDEQIRGRAALVFYPLGHFGRLRPPDYSGA
jgi:signal peptidase I